MMHTSREKRCTAFVAPEVSISEPVRTVISSVIPLAAVNDKFLLELSKCGSDALTGLVALRASFAFDSAARQKLGDTSLKFFTWTQLPVPTPSLLSNHALFILPRVLELTYTTTDMKQFATYLNDTGAPFRWNQDRRRHIRAELDALFFHLYGISRDDVDYILGTFPIDRRKDEAKYGTYRTKELILTEYDRMAAASLILENSLVDGENYTSTLTPPPGHGPRHPA
ncbi:hypothetical protein [Streptomyces sp. NPDC057381]|uniref:hypothetical protein n=1 Tax=Streptomyces sp. NPDC057381 TaxID=3346111 RepID=UPI003630B8B9